MKKVILLFLIFMLLGIGLLSCKPGSSSLLPTSTPKIQLPSQTPTQSLPVGPTPELYEEGARARYCSKDFCLILEFLEDDLLHGEFAIQGSQHDLTKPITVSPMIYNNEFEGPVMFSLQPDGSLATNALRVTVDTDLCFTVVDIQRQPEWQMARYCPTDMKGYRKHISIESPDITDIYGLGEQFIEPGVMDGNWFGKTRYPGVEQGNAMVSFNGGMAGNAQFSVAYFLGPQDLNYALFIDNPAVQIWNFRTDPWDVNIAGNAVRFYVIGGSDLPTLRQKYMTLTGTPPVPPKKMFGLWVSEYGYDNWSELESKLSTLRKNHFPVDGFVLDLQWFGGITSGSENSRMGSLTWDTAKFPDPQDHIAKYASEGIGIMTIEESYISAGLPEYSTLSQKGYLVRECKDCDPVVLYTNPWWGIGGMIDWTNQEGADFWNDWKRQPLIEAGIMGHWTDLGEPEAFALVSWYSGYQDEYSQMHNQYDLHNLYNFSWSQSIYEGYLRNKVNQRPFILSRSGAPGSQRFGVSMWSGDVASNLDSLAAHLQVQGQMSLSGVDYFGSDIGGFNRYGLVGNINDVYTPWLATGVLLDVPVRTHTQNLCNCNETAPDRVGDLDSNLANVRLRYEISPYLYSLAHRAYLYGEPVFPPVVYYFQKDENVRKMGGEKMIGQNMLAAFSAKLFQEYIDVYLPSGNWVNFYTNEWISSKGEWLKDFPLINHNLFQQPLFIREGAIIPLMYVDDQTMNITGQRLDGTVRNELILRIVPGTESTDFTLYEDDGTSTAYQKGAVRTTLITQQKNGSRLLMKINASQGTYEGAFAERNNVIEVIMNNPGKPRIVTINEIQLDEADSETVWQTMDSGWYYAAPNVLMIKTGQINVEVEKLIEVEF